MTRIYVPDYWPQFFHPGQNKLARFVYPAVGAVPGYSSTFFYDPATKAMKLVQYDLAGDWMSNWYLKVQPNGLFEVRDELPQKIALLASIFGPKIVENYSTPIGWGGGAPKVGPAFPYSNRPSLSPFSCRPPQFGSGLQVVVFETIFTAWTDPSGKQWDDVLVMLYQQSWNSGAPTGARWYMPLGIGPVAAQWVSGQTTEQWQYAEYSVEAA
jgi:hypothetical protein